MSNLFDISEWTWYNESNEGEVMSQKDTQGKLKLNLIPPRALKAIALVREFGVNKYKEEWGWLKSVTREQLQEAGKRHQLREDMGELVDPESGLPHAYHRLCSYAMEVELLMLEMEKQNEEKN